MARAWPLSSSPQMFKAALPLPHSPVSTSLLPSHTSLLFLLFSLSFSLLSHNLQAVKLFLTWTVQYILKFCVARVLTSRMRKRMSVCVIPSRMRMSVYVTPSVFLSTQPSRHCPQLVSILGVNRTVWLTTVPLQFLDSVRRSPHCLSLRQFSKNGCSCF